jgi:hypothetical protein
MHCSDEELLACLDGGLSALGERRVRRHLKACWRCRTRLGAYEKEIHRLTTEVDEWAFPEPEWTREARQRLDQRLKQFESSFSEPRSRSYGVWAMRGALAAAALILCIGAGFLWMRNSRARLRPAEVIAHATTVERALYQQPVHQTFSVKIAQIRPVPKAVTTQLEIWCDRGSGRFAARLSESGGSIKHALWRPSADAEFLYRPAQSQSLVRQSPHQAQSVSLVSLADYGLEPEQLESGFMRWLESRSWSAISFASDISVWSAEDGTTVRAERVPGDGGSPAVRLTAQRKSRRMVAILTLDVDSNSYWPRIQTLRFETPERAVEFRLAATSIRPVRPAEVASSVYPPDLRAGIDRQVAIPQREGVPAFPVQPAPNNSDAGPVSPEVEAHYALHKAGACLGQAVRVSEDSGGTRIWKLADGSGGQLEGFTTTAEMSYVLNALADVRRAPPAPMQLQQAEGSPQPLVAALRHAWAIERLAGDFPHQRTQGMSASSRRLLALMLREHIVSVRRAYSELGLRMSPSADRRPDGSDWRQSASVLFESLTRLRQVLQLQPPGDDLEQLGEKIDSRMRLIADDLAVEAGQVGAGLRGSRHSR